MTQNDIAYMQYRETARHNVRNENEDFRSHLANETETKRHNIATEGETKRHNIATEYNQAQSNLVSRLNALTAADATKYAAQIGAQAHILSAQIGASASRYVADSNYKSNLATALISSNTSRWNTSLKSRTDRDIAKSNNYYSYINTRNTITGSLQRTHMENVNKTLNTGISTGGRLIENLVNNATRIVSGLAIGGK